jgi:hypothetical protein
VDTICIAVKTSPTWVNRVGGGSLIILLFKILVLNAYPAPAHFHYLYELGQLTENLLAATVAAFIFFIVSYQVPLVIEKRAVGPVIAMLSDQVVQNALTVVFMVNHFLNAKDGKATVPNPLTLDDVNRLFASINPNDSTNMSGNDLGVPQSWIDAFINWHITSRSYLDQVLTYSRFLDGDFASRLFNVRFAPYSFMMDRYKGYRDSGSGSGKRFAIGNNDMSVFANMYFQFYQRAKDLQSYNEQFRAQYNIPGVYPIPPNERK